MTDLNNKLNLNNVRGGYAPNFKKDEAKELPVKFEEDAPEVKGDGTQAAESYGRILVKQAGKADNPEMLQGIKEAMEFYANNPELAGRHMLAGDKMHELLEAEGVEHPYEEACCLACDEAYNHSK